MSVLDDTPRVTNVNTDLPTKEPNGQLDDDQAADNQSNDGSPQETLEERFERIQKENDALRSTNNRILDENKKIKSNYKYEKEERLKQEKNYRQLYKERDSELNALKQEIEQGAIVEAVAVEASRRGVKHWRHLYNSADHSGLRYDSETREVYGVTDFFERHQNDPEYELFFKRPTPPAVNNNTPGISTEIGSVQSDADALKYLEDMIVPVKACAEAMMITLQMEQSVDPFKPIDFHAPSVLQTGDRMNIEDFIPFKPTNSEAEVYIPEKEIWTAQKHMDAILNLQRPKQKELREKKRKEDQRKMREQGRQTSFESKKDVKLKIITVS